MSREDAAERRVAHFDYVRVLALATVVAIHVMAAYLSNRSTVLSPDVALIFDHWLHYAVPTFVFVSGALVWGRLRSWDRRVFGEFARRRFVVVVVPYVAWSALYYVLRPAAGVGAFPTAFRAMAGQFIELLLNGHTWYHLYFVPMIVVFYALTPVAQTVARRSPEGLLLLALGVRVLFGPSIVGAFAGSPYYGVMKPLLVDSVEHVSYMALGAWYGLRQAGQAGRWVQRLWPAALVAGSAMWVARVERYLAVADPRVDRLLEFVAMALVVLGWVGLFRVAERSWHDRSRRLAHVASLSYGAYLAHPLVILGVRKGVGLLGVGGWWDLAPFVVGVYGLVIAVTLGLVHVLSKTPLARRLV